MKRITASLLVLSIGLATTTLAQDLKIPQPSTAQKIEQDFGLGQVSLTYSRPNVKGRKIFGLTEPYGLVWRTGANWATRFKINDSIMIEKHMLAPGEYALFTIPGPGEWTIIFNKTVQQWGAYSYDSTKDVLRFKVKAGKLPQLQETLTFQFANAFVDHCELQLLWENTIITLHLEVDVDARIMANIDQMMKADKKPYYQAAIYYYNHDKDMTKALEWITEADKASPGAYNMKYWKARIQLKAGDKAGAIATANEGLKLAQAEPNAEYIRLNKEVLTAAGSK